MINLTEVEMLDNAPGPLTFLALTTDLDNHKAVSEAKLTINASKENRLLKDSLVRYLSGIITLDDAYFCEQDIDWVAQYKTLPKFSQLIIRELISVWGVKQHELGAQTIQNAAISKLTLTIKLISEIEDNLELFYTGSGIPEELGRQLVWTKAFRGPLTDYRHYVQATNETQQLVIGLAEKYGYVHFQLAKELGCNVDIDGLEEYCTNTRHKNPIVMVGRLAFSVEANKASPAFCEQLPRSVVDHTLARMCN